jgi:hypothetical protein
MSVRNLNLHEYQSMQIMDSFNVAIPAGGVGARVFALTSDVISHLRLAAGIHA